MRTLSELDRSWQHRLDSDPDLANFGVLPECNHSSPLIHSHVTVRCLLSQIWFYIHCKMLIDHTGPLRGKGGVGHKILRSNIHHFCTSASVSVHYICIYRGLNLVHMMPFSRCIIHSKIFCNGSLRLVLLWFESCITTSIIALLQCMSHEVVACSITVTA